jgi:hypothetical protein
VRSQWPRSGAAIRKLAMGNAELDWAVHVVLRHSLVNVANAFLKARGARGEEP